MRYGKKIGKEKGLRKINKKKWEEKVKGERKNWNEIKWRREMERERIKGKKRKSWKRKKGIIDEEKEKGRFLNKNIMKKRGRKKKNKRKVELKKGEKR